MNDNRISVSKNCNRIYDCYKYTNKELKELVLKIIEERNNKKYETTRTKESYLYEAVAHKRLYKLGIARSHTDHADLEEPISKWLDFICSIFGRCWC